jgi:predicted ferric reductase
MCYEYWKICHSLFGVFYSLVIMNIIYNLESSVWYQITITFEMRLYPNFNPKMPRVIFFGVQMILNRPRLKTKAIFHPMIFG